MCCWAREHTAEPTIQLCRSRQATLHTAPAAPHAGSTPSRSCRLYGNHALGPPRRRGQRLHAIADRPVSLTPSTNPPLGVESQHQELHRCALDGFLGPSSGIAASTRILRHLPKLIKLFGDIYSNTFPEVRATIEKATYPACTAITVPAPRYNPSGTGARTPPGQSLATLRGLRGHRPPPATWLPPVPAGRER